MDLKLFHAVGHGTTRKKTEPAGTGQAHNFDSTVSTKLKLQFLISGVILQTN